MPWTLPELIDIPNLQMLLNRLHAAAGIPVGIIDKDGKILVATGWQDICVKFHRDNLETAERCRQSDNYIKTRLDTENYVQYKCRNGLWDLAKPIIIAGSHVATLFLGQFFYDDEEVDEEFFRKQAQEFGFDLDSYMAALERVPVYSREKAQNIMNFYSAFVDLLANMGLVQHRQKETEQTLRESEERYRALFEGANDAIMTIRDGHFVNCNRQALEMFGCKVEEIIGKRPEHLSPAIQPDGIDSVAKVLDKLLQAQTGSPQFFEWQHCRCDGTLFDAEISLNRLEYQGKTELLAVIRDITARKQTERALKASEAEKSLILDSTVDLVIYHDLDMKILWGNRIALNSVGLQPQELTGRDCWELWHQRTDACVGCPVVLARDTGEPQQAEMRSPDGRKWYIRGFPVKDDNGNLQGVVEFCLDITDQKRMEEEIKALNADLASYTMELQAANRELEAFNYTVSHDLCSPLTGIHGYCQVLLEMYGERLGEEGVGFVHEISRAAEDMDELITTMLNFSRLLRNKVTRHTVDLTGMAKVAAAQLRMNEPQRNVTFTIAEGVMAKGDAKLLNLVLENLIGNAWKYTSKQEKALIEFGAAKLNGGTVYFVRDNGVGFDMIHADKLFKPFERLPGTTDIPGHGIGLATVQRIIQRHGGRVWAEGEPGKGATFYFTV